MIARQQTHRLISPADLSPSDPRLRIVSVFNPGVAEIDGRPVLLARVAEAPAEQEDGIYASPAIRDGHLQIDRFSADDVIEHDMRVFELRSTGHLRLTFISHLRVIWLDQTGTAIDRIGDPVMPVGDLETYGIEDPRITKLDGRWCITYVGVSRHGVSTMLATTNDFESFDRHGIIFNTMNKDVVLFPEKIGGRYAALHRPMGEFNPPEMWLAYSHDLMHWGDHQPLRGVGGTHWAAGKTGAGCPPIRIDDGWLEIYHGNDKQPGEDGVGTYFGGTLLLAADDPSRVLKQLPEPIMRPEADFERHGFVPNVVFPTGLIERGDHMLCYYGAADEHIGVVTWDTSYLLATLQ